MNEKEIGTEEPQPTSYPLKRAKKKGEIDQDAIVAAVLAQLAVTKGPEQAAATDISGIVAGILSEMKKESNLFKVSSGPFVPVYPFNPENYDVRLEADKVATMLGHELSEWVSADANTKDFWHARCVTCSAPASARWRRRPLNDKRQFKADEAPVVPYFGGEALSKTEAECRKSDARNKRNSFQRRSSVA